MKYRSDVIKREFQPTIRSEGVRQLDEILNKILVEERNDIREDVESYQKYYQVPRAFGSDFSREMIAQRRVLAARNNRCILHALVGDAQLHRAREQDFSPVLVAWDCVVKEETSPGEKRANRMLNYARTNYRTSGRVSKTIIQAIFIKSNYSPLVRSISFFFSSSPPLCLREQS